MSEGLNHLEIEWIRDREEKCVARHQMCLHPIVPMVTSPVPSAHVSAVHRLGSFPTRGSMRDVTEMETGGYDRHHRQ